MTMAIHFVKRAVVKVSVGPANGNRVARILQAGDIVPEGVDQAQLDSLEKRGLIEQLPEENDEVEIPEGDPAESWTVPQLKAYAKAKGIELGKVKSKPEVLALVSAKPEGE